MANIGTIVSTAEGLWESKAFQMLFEESGGWDAIKEKLIRGETCTCMVSSPQQLKVLKQFMTEEDLRAKYKQNFLEDPTPFWPSRCVLNPEEKDSVTTYQRYTYDGNIAELLTHVLPGKKIECHWFVDGEGDYGSFYLLDGVGYDIVKGNLQEDLMTPEERDEYLHHPLPFKHCLEDIKAFAEKNFCSDDDNKPTVVAKDRAVSNPWMDGSGRFELSDADAVKEWGLCAVIRFCAMADKILTENEEKSRKIVNAETLGESLDADELPF